MKKLILIPLFAMLLGCEKGDFYHYTLQNKSGKNIKISSYNKIYPVRDYPVFIELKNGAELTKTFQDLIPPMGYDFSVFLEGDSIIINYNNEKKQIFTFSGGQYGQGASERNIYIFSGTLQNYIFTPEDFKNATPCNGNCD